LVQFSSIFLVFIPISKFNGERVMRSGPYNANQIYLSEHSSQTSLKDSKRYWSKTITNPLVLGIDENGEIMFKFGGIHVKPLPKHNTYVLFSHLHKTKRGNLPFIKVIETSLSLTSNMCLNEAIRVGP